MEFKVWLEAQFVDIPKDAMHALENMVKKTKNNIRKMLSLEDQGYPKHRIGVIDIDGKTISVFLDNIPLPQYLHLPDTLEGEIVIPYHGNMKEVLHELGHAFDPKMKSNKWKNSDRYNKLQNKAQRGIALSDEEQKSYTKEPAEFEAYGAEMAARIKIVLGNLPPEQKPIFIQQLERWLRNGGESPTIARIDPAFIAACKTKPTLWRRCQQKLFNLIQELK